MAYGAPDKPVRAVVAGLDAEVSLEVIHSGPAIDPRTRDRIFDSLRSGPDQEDNNPRGLGLYIASEIAKAHHGSISGTHLGRP
ncbi:sensor histidine kinase [Cupriavidus neocaledonicus]|uniref:sensor histidine kinase n=1 Tax=Cupriavidus neocaledonicus TaxID=1040979 RepID=UPI002795D7D3|nr:ATP-binding protein [Cupriavidus neocaledonicus]